jgi:hypothetical protein
MGGRLIFNATKLGAGAVTEVMRLEADIGMSAFGTNVIFNTSSAVVALQAPPYSKQVPTTGFSITIANTVNSLILNPAGTLATGTVTMPATPQDGQTVTIASTQIVTALTVSANTGQTLSGTITTIAANGFATWQYVLADTNWYRVG